MARDTFRLRISAGGYLAHFVPIGSYRATCGYMPQDKPLSSMHRARWTHATDDPRSICRRCIDSQRPSTTGAPA